MPEVTLSKPASIIRTVVFPEPDGPSSVMNFALFNSDVEAFDDQRFF